jgi:hypothetical protein
MPTIQADVSTRDLLKAVEQLSLTELDSFVANVLDLRARRIAPSLSPAEAALLDKIVEPLLQEDKHGRYHELRKKLQAKDLTQEEHGELVSLSDELEEQNAKRVEALGQLAQLRRQPVEELMKELGVKPCNNE